MTSETGISKTTIHRVLKIRLRHPYKIQLHQHLSEDDPDRQVQVWKWADKQCAKDELFLSKILFLIKRTSIFAEKLTVRTLNTDHQQIHTGYKLPKNEMPIASWAGAGNGKIKSLALFSLRRL